QIEDIPTSRLRGAAQGFVELHGRAAALPQDSALHAPLSGEDCVWWACRVYRLRSSGDKKRWELVRDEASALPFVVDDGSGLGLVLPAGADAESVRWRQWEPDSTTRHVEGTIRAGDELYVLGELQTLRAPWQRAPGDTAALLPEIEAMSLRRFADNPAPGVNLVAKPRDGRHFILATQSQKSLVSGERWAAAICLLLFACLIPSAAIALVGAWGKISLYYLP
ncbi:MAG TPA: hypothetical protein VLI06_09430, partial [Solimonas sp.]|nr:hypothetical protein [Solimonas sp.]